MAFRHHSSRPRRPSSSPARFRPRVECLEGRLVPASTADLANAIAQQAPVLVAIPKEHLTGLQCHQHFEQVRQAIEHIVFTPTSEDADALAEQAAFNQLQRQFLGALDQAEMKCGGQMEGTGGHRGRGRGHPGMHPVGFTGPEPAFFTTRTFETRGPGDFFGPVDDHGTGTGCGGRHAEIDGAMRVVIKRTNSDFFNPTFRVVSATLDLHQRPGLCEDFSGVYGLQGQGTVSHGRVSFVLQGGGQGNGSNPATATIRFDGTLHGGILSGNWSFDAGEASADHGEGAFRLHEVH